MEAIPLFLASASKAILLGAVVPDMSHDAAPTVDSTAAPAAPAAPAVAPEAAVPVAPEVHVAEDPFPPVPETNVTVPGQPVHPVHPVDSVDPVPSETTTMTSVAAAGATETGEATGAAAAGAGAEDGAAGADASAGNSPDAASAVQAQAVHGQADSSDSAPSALKGSDQQIVEAVNAKVKDLSKASFSSQTEPTHPHPSHANPVMDETTSMMYVTQKIRDHFLGGISPADISSVVKESVTVLREFDQLNEWVMRKGYLMAEIFGRNWHNIGWPAWKMYRKKLGNQKYLQAAGWPDCNRGLCH